MTTHITCPQDTDLLNLFKEALQYEKIHTYAFNDPNPGIEKIRANPYQSTIYTNHIRPVKDTRRKPYLDTNIINTCCNRQG